MPQLIFTIAEIIMLSSIGGLAILGVLMCVARFSAISGKVPVGFEKMVNYVNDKFPSKRLEVAIRFFLGKNEEEKPKITRLKAHRFLRWYVLGSLPFFLFDLFSAEDKFLFLQGESVFILLFFAVLFVVLQNLFFNYLEKKGVIEMVSEDREK